VRVARSLVMAMTGWGGRSRASTRASLAGVAPALSLTISCHDQAGLRVVGRAERGQPEFGVLDGEPVQVDPLPVHEPNPADGPLGGHTAAWARSSMTRGRPVTARPLLPSVRTTMRVRSARNRSRENS